MGFLTLAFDTSSPAGSVALLDNKLVLASRQLDPEERSAKTLAPAIERLLRQCAVSPHDVKLIATTVGPGSFTGLRVGVTLAKTLAYALGCEVIGLNTLDVIAAQTPPEFLSSPSPRLHVVLDAQRRELFAAQYRLGSALSGRLERTNAETTIVPAARWLADLRPGDAVSGTGMNRFLAQIPGEIAVMDAPHRQPQATTIGILAFEEYQHGRRDDLWKLAPLYIRPSYAEEKK